MTKEEEERWRRNSNHFIQNIMTEEEAQLSKTPLIIFLLLLISGTLVVGNSLERDKEVLLKLKAHLETKNNVNLNQNLGWNETSNPCQWSRVSCTDIGMTMRVSKLHLSHFDISGKMFQNFSELTELTHLDLSKNTLGGEVPLDLTSCHKLEYLNLSHNILEGEINLTGLHRLHTLDLSSNRFYGDVELNFPGICENLVILNMSDNQFTGRIDKCFNECWKLRHLDLSINQLGGGIWMSFARLKEFWASENYLNGSIPSSVFVQNCSLELLHLSGNEFEGEIPKEICNCQNLVTLNFWGNHFSGKIPKEIGNILRLEGLYLGSNNLSAKIPETLMNLPNLQYLDLSRLRSGGDIQEIFGKLVHLRFLTLHSNHYTGGIYSSGILKLQNLTRLDLSNNEFSGPLPVEFSEMPRLRFLVLAYNKFNGTIPPEFGYSLRLQALDLSYNKLSGPIPPTFGNLNSLLWLMLANNSLFGEIPPELGNCTSLLWLNLANNKLSGKFSPKLTRMGRNAMPTFLMNRDYYRSKAGSGECMATKRFIPAEYPPLKFVYSTLTRTSCKSLWDKLLKGYGVFQVCSAGSPVWKFQYSGYIQLSGNQLTSEIPPEIGNMQNFTMLDLSYNKFYGKVPPEIENIPLLILNLTKNNLSGEIPMELGNMKCLDSLDLSHNNFSGMFPSSLKNLNQLIYFNISYNPLLSGTVPTAGQFSTFGEESYYGNPLLKIPHFINDSPQERSPSNTTLSGETKLKKPAKLAALLIFLALTLVFLICGGFSFIVCALAKSPAEAPKYFLHDSKRHDYASSSGHSSPWLSSNVEVIRLDQTTFTHADILEATGNFSEERIIGRGGYGTVYKGVLPDGRKVAVKKLLREGIEGEKEFHAEMVVLSGNGIGWPHPNLVPLYGWCLDGSEKILVYEYMEGGSLEDLIADRTRLTWWQRIDVAIDVARALVFLHHDCHPCIVHRDVKASNILLDNDGKARVTDFGLARVVGAGNTHVSTMVAGTVGYVAPEYGQTGKATTKGDVYSFGVLAMELATGRRAVDGKEECLLDWGRRVMDYGYGRQELKRHVKPVALMGCGLAEGAEEMCELLRIGVKCATESPQGRPNMKVVLEMLVKMSCFKGDFRHAPPLLNHRV